jgi:hypothetical protein
MVCSSFIHWFAAVDVCLYSNADNPVPLLLCCCAGMAVVFSPCLQVGFVAQLSKGASRSVVADALKMLARMSHRGACGCEENTGDHSGR